MAGVAPCRVSKRFDIPRILHRRQVLYSEDGQVFISASGKLASGLARVYAPTTEEVRAMLIRLRRRQRWSQGTLAAVLAVPRDTLRRWEDRSRRPCRSARKLIWLVHALVFEPQELLGGLESIITWGQARRGGEQAQ